MNSVLNLNTTQTTANLWNCIEYSLSGTVVDWYDSLSENSKNILRMMETSATMFRNLCKETETEFIGVKLDFKGKSKRMAKKY